MITIRPESEKVTKRSQCRPWRQREGRCFRIIRYRLFKVQSREARIAVPHFRPLLQEILRTPLPVTGFQTVFRLTPCPPAKHSSYSYWRRLIMLRLYEPPAA